MTQCRRKTRQAGVLCIAFLSCAGVVAAREIARPINITPASSERKAIGGVRLLGTLALARTHEQGCQVAGLSALAWDPEQELLYAVSDRGCLFHLAPRFTNGELTGATLVTAAPLRDADGRPLRGAWADAEGAFWRHPAGLGSAPELVISFERHPRVVRYSTIGVWLGEDALPAALANPDAYAHPNHMLEALCAAPTGGWLVAPERPLRSTHDPRFSVHDQRGHVWRFAAGDPRHGALVALEPLPDGSLLALERRYVAPLAPFVVSLHRVDLRSGGDADVQELAHFNTADGWAIDNFEGLTRHVGWRYFMVSDDNAHPLQHTLLVYFEILPAAFANVR
jgi:hypothetical protein